jgi:hypothetical protein
MDQVSQRKIKIIDNVYVMKLLKSDDVIEEEPAAGGKEGQAHPLKVPLADLLEAHVKPEHHREFE